MFLDFINPELVINITNETQIPQNPITIINLLSINLIRDEFQALVKYLQPDHGKHLTASEIMDLLKRTIKLSNTGPNQEIIPSCNNITTNCNLIFPNCVANSWQDYYNGILRLINFKELWEITGNLTWIDARAVIFHTPKLKNEIVLFIENLLPKCQTLLITPPPFMILTDFWTEILSKIQGHEKIIFYTKKQSQTARTTSAAIIPEHIGKLQSEFYKSFQMDYRFRPKLETHLKTSGTNSQISNFECPMQTKPQEKQAEKPIVIIELEKMQKQIEEYYKTYPDAANLETGMLLEKINEIRESLGLSTQ